jgi:hypothetical protein
MDTMRQENRLNPSNPPIEQELPQLTLEALVKMEHPDPDGPPTFQLLSYPAKIDEAQLAKTGQGFSLRGAITDIATQMQASGGIHAPIEENTMMFFPWHMVQWIRIKLEAREIEREPLPKAKGLVTIGE